MSGNGINFGLLVTDSPAGPAPISDYAPPGFAGTTLAVIGRLDLTPATPTDPCDPSTGGTILTGLAGGGDGQLLLVRNAAPPTGPSLTLAAEYQGGTLNNASRPQNRFDFGCDLVLPPKLAALLAYYGNLSRWVLVSTSHYGAF